MENQRPLILVSNDDGITAKGISELIKFLRPLGEIVVMAPDTARSGTSCSLTVKEPIHYQLLRKEVGLTVYKCSGTPTDCVKLAFHTVLDRKPSLVVGGINHGDNSSVNMHYSGTMGVASEGALQGFPAIAFSLCDHRADADFTPLRPYLVDLVMKAIAMGLPPFTCLNVNFPLRPRFEGLRVCRMARSRWTREFERRRKPGGGDYFWMTGECIELEPEAEDTDRWALAHGYVAVTPTTLDATATGLIDVLSGRL